MLQNFDPVSAGAEVSPFPAKEEEMNSVDKAMLNVQHLMTRLAERLIQAGRHRRIRSANRDIDALTSEIAAIGYESLSPDSSRPRKQSDLASRQALWDALVQKQKELELLEDQRDT